MKWLPGDRLAAGAMCLHILLTRAAAGSACLRKGCMQYTQRLRREVARWPPRSSCMSRLRLC